MKKETGNAADDQRLRAALVRQGRDEEANANNRRRRKASPDRRTKLGRRDSALLAVLEGTGMGMGEVCRLRLDDVDFREGTAFFTIRRPKVRSHHQARTIPLLWPDTYLRNIQGYVRSGRHKFPQSDWLFSGRKGEPLSTRQVGRLVQQRCNYSPREVRAEFIRAAEAMFTLDELCTHLGIHPPRRTAKGWPFRSTRKMQQAIADRRPSPELREVLLARDEYRCSACGQHLTKGQAEIDHIDPTGPTVLSNLQVLCHPCNAWKKDCYVIDFRALWEWLDSRREESPESSIRSPT
jgi:integrase